MNNQKELEEKILAVEYCDLIGKVFGSGEGVGNQVRLWEMRNFNERIFYEMDVSDMRKGIVLLMRIRIQRLLAGGV